MDIPPESKQTPLPTTAIGFVRFDRAPFQRMATSRLSRADPLPTAMQRVHPQFAHRLLVERLHVDAEFLQRFGAIGELDRKKHVGRLVDQIARQLDAFGDSEALLRSRARGDRMARADDEIGRLEAVLLRVFPARLVFVEPIAAQAKAERKIGRRRAIPHSRRGLESDFDSFRAGHFAKGEPAECDEVDRCVVLARSDADNHEPEASRPAGARMSSAVRWAPRKLDAFAAARMSGSISPNWAVTVGAGFMSAPTKTTSALPLGAERAPKAILTAPLMTNACPSSRFDDFGQPRRRRWRRAPTYRGVCHARQ